DVSQARKEALRILGGQKQCQLLGRGEQDIRRVQLLALALVRGRIAGACFDVDVEANPLDRLAEIALNINGERLEGRNVERMNTAIRLAGLTLWPHRKVGQRGKKAGQGLSRSGWCNQQDRFSRLCLIKQLKLVRSRAPASLDKPARETIGKYSRGRDVVFHSPQVAPGRCLSKSKQPQLEPLFLRCLETLSCG